MVPTTTIENRTQDVARGSRQTGEREGPFPPLLIVDGNVNALSVARRVARMGVKVYAIGASASPARHSRHCHWIDVRAAGNPVAVWRDYLLGPRGAHLQGAVLLAAGDYGLELLAEHRPSLQERFILDDASPEAQRSLLNKLATFQAAQEVGVPTPRFWTPRSMEDVLALEDQLVYPLIIKPELSHLFQKHFRGRRFFEVATFDELLKDYQTVADFGLRTKLVEKIPGRDDKLCSYYTYLDERGNPLFDFTKRVVRRHPPNMGIGCYHVVDDVADVRELALAVFRQVGVRGLANAEFMLDERDGRLKLIECNLRFTATNELIARCGLDLGRFCYARAAGLSTPRFGRTRTGLSVWYPLEDLRSFLKLRKRGQLTTGQWIRSILRWHTLPVFQWSDPWPSVVRQFDQARRAIGMIARRQPR